MSLAFSRSMRAVKSDRQHAATIGLYVTGLFLLAWAGWFFLARITVYETGEIVAVTQDGLVAARFSSEALQKIQVEQQAWIRTLDATGNAAVPIPAVVWHVAPSLRGTPDQITLYPAADIAAFELLQKGLAGQVDVEVAQLSPALLVARFTGQLIDTPPVSLSPQQ